MLQKNLKAFSKKGGSASAVASDMSTTAEAVWDELQSSRQKTKSQIPTHPHWRRTSTHWKDFPTVWHLHSCRWRFPLHSLSLPEKQLPFARSVCLYTGWDIPMKHTTKRSTIHELHICILWRRSFIPCGNWKPSFLWLPYI